MDTVKGKNKGNPGISQRYVALIFLLMIIYGINNQAIGTLITRIIIHYNITMAVAGLITSFTNAGNFAAILIITVFAGRINKMILMAASLFFYAASVCLLSAAPPYSFLLIIFALIGIFGATIDTLCNSLVADLMPAKIGLGISLLHGFFGLGGLCGPVLIENLALKMSWMQVYLAIGGVLFIYLAIYAAVIKWQWRRLSALISPEKQTRFGFTDMVQFFGKKRHVLLWVTMFFYAGNQSTVAVWIKRYVETHLNEPAWGAYTLSAVWLGTALSRLVISPGIKASSPRKIFIGNLISAAALAAGLLSGSAKGMAAASLVIGLSSGLTIPLVLATGCEWYPEKTAFGTMMPFTACFISYVVFPPFSGFIGDFLGIRWGIAVAALCALLAAVFSAALDMDMKSRAA